MSHNDPCIDTSLVFFLDLLPPGVVKTIPKIDGEKPGASLREFGDASAGAACAAGEKRPTTPFR